MAYKIKTSGVYIVQSISHPNRVYIGSACDILTRWCNHKKNLSKNTHHSIKLQNHYNKYGEDDLVFEILEEGKYLDKNHLLSREQGWYYHFKHGNKDIPYFNIAPNAGSCEGIKRSRESRDKMSIAKKGKTTWNKGKAGTYTHTEEAKLNMSIVGKNKAPMPQAVKDKISNTKKGHPFYGKKHHSEETKEKLRILKSNPSEELLKKQRDGVILYWIKWREEHDRSPIPVHKPSRKKYLELHPELQGTV